MAASPRSRWALMGAVVASATIAPRLAQPVHAAELTRRLEWLRVAVPGDTRLPVPRRSPQTPAGRPPQFTFDIPAGPVRGVIAEIARATQWTIEMDPSLGDIVSPGVSGALTPLQAIERALEGTNITVRVTGDRRAALDIRVTAESIEVSADTPRTRPSSAKYSAPLLEVPQTIDIISSEVMQAQGVRTLSDALRNVPGVTLQAGEGGGASNTSGDMFNLRGFNASNSVFVDGVRDDGLMSRDVFNLEQVEVFMGPAGTDIGRGNAAGYVNMQTKTPHAGQAYEVDYSYASGGQSRTTVDVNHDLPIGSRESWLGRSAVRLNALWEDGGVAGRDVVTRKNQSIAPSAAFGIGTPTRITGAAQVTRQENVPDYGVPGSAWRDYPLAPATVLADAPVSSRNFYGSVGYDFDRVEQDSYTGRIEHDVNSRLTLRNQTRYNQTHRTAIISAIRSPASFVPETQEVTLSRQGNERENQIVSNQTSANVRFGTRGLSHALAAGVEIAREQQYAPALVGLGTRSDVDIYHPNPFDAVVGYAPVRGLAFSRGKTSTIGAYAFDTVELGGAWQVNGGIRWERYQASFAAADETGAPTADLRAADSLVSGKAGVLYRLAESANVYASFGSAVTPPGTANFTLSAQPNNQNSPNVRPQKSRNYEAGGKFGFFDDRFSLTAAVFRTDNENVIFTVDAAAIPPIFNQDDRQRVSGLSIGSTGRITPRWSVLASLGYLDSRQFSQNPANNGNRLTLTPQFSGSTWSTYDFPKGLTLGGGIRYTDEVFVNSANTIRVPGYVLADAMVEYDVNAHLSLRLNVNNATGASYIRNVNNNGGRFNPGAPRSASLTSSVRF